MSLLVGLDVVLLALNLAFAVVHAIGRRWQRFFFHTVLSIAMLISVLYLLDGMVR